MLIKQNSNGKGVGGIINIAKIGGMIVFPTSLL